jgi:hypothetical protein
MIAEYNRKSFIFGIPGIIFQIAAFFMPTRDRIMSPLGAILVLAGTGLLLVGLAFYAKAKGRHPVWGLFGLLSIIGLIVLGCLKDKSGQILSESPTTQDMSQVTAPMTSRMAVALFALSLSGIIYFLCVPNLRLLPLLIFAVILGCVALRHIKTSGGLLSGRGRAVAGVTISLLFLLVIRAIVGTHGSRDKSVDYNNRGDIERYNGGVEINKPKKYRDIIDALVSMCQEGQGQIAARRVRDGIWNQNATEDFIPEQHEINLFLQRLTVSEREILAEMLAQEVVKGVFETLKTLEAFQVPPFEEGYEGSPFDDFLWRLDEWEWPE